MPPHTRLFVGNLPENTDENALRSAFNSYGEITNFELKSKSNADEESKKFAFITLSTDDYNVESCLKHFSSHEFGGSRLYVTRARESFLERLQRERQQAQALANAKEEEPVIPKEQPVLKLSEKLNPRKRNIHKHINGDLEIEDKPKRNNKKHDFPKTEKVYLKESVPAKESPILSEADKKKQDADKKRMESIKRKRQEFKQKQMIIKTGLVGIDKAQNKKVVFSDSDNELPANEAPSKKTVNGVDSRKQKPQNTLFDDDDSGDEVNFEIKKQFEGVKGQKVLELQSRYKSDKRFVLDERFADDDEEAPKVPGEESEGIELGDGDEKNKQLNILQDVLGIAIKTRAPDAAVDKKKKTKFGMLRFDPSQPEHSKFLAPVEEKQEPPKKKKKKNKEETEVVETPRPEVPTVEVSKEQFYKVSENLKQAIEQPTTFSLRSLFSKGNDDEEPQDQREQQDQSYIPLTKQTDKIKNPLDPGERNPFKYDSSDSEDEEETPAETKETKAEVKAVWMENLFFSKEDSRLIEGLSFFNEKPDTEVQKDRKEMKYVMKKRLYNKERKEHENMFKKKIGGRRKTQKKSFKKRKA